jgi:hypothetical protein
MKKDLAGFVRVDVSPTGKRAYTATAELWTTKDDRAVLAGDKDAKALLVGEGGSISGREAARYGLLEPAEAALYPTDEERAAQTAEIERMQREGEWPEPLAEAGEGAT